MATVPTDVEAMTDHERVALETLCARLGDDEFVLAERYTEWQVRAPSLESDLALSNIAQDELGHARLWYDVLDDLGHAEVDVLYERDAADFRHATLCELPFAEGDWADAVVRSYLYDVAEALRLEALADSTHPKIADRVPKIAAEETYHREHAETWLERLAEDAGGRERLQAALDRLFPHALALFEPAVPPAFGRGGDRPSAAEVEATIVERGLRTETLDEIAQEWLDVVTTTLIGLDLAVPLEGDAVTPEALRPETGRDGAHTDAWFELYDDFTRTYRELGRTDTTRIMPDPTDG
ncbi:MAG: 1,2-phenylacetyl-CoA epoxidase subunit PaaC [Halobacteriales archaeon]